MSDKFLRTFENVREYVRKKSVGKMKFESTY